MPRNLGICSALFALAIGASAYIYLAMPHDREVTSLGILLFKLVPFVLASFAIASIDFEWVRERGLDLLAIPASYLVVLCLFVPRAFFLASDFEALYYNMLMMCPYVILALVFSFRLAGGSTERTLRLSFAMLLLMLSGLEDLAFLVVNPHTDPQWATIPEVWNWASHMTVFLGHPPTKYEAYMFIVSHVILAGVVLLGRVPERARILALGYGK